MYAWGAQSVKCACCNQVTPVNASTITSPPQTQANAGSSAGPSGTGNVAAAGKAVHAVYVENPPSIDEHGNEVCMVRCSAGYSTLELISTYA